MLRYFLWSFFAGLFGWPSVHVRNQVTVNNDGGDGGEVSVYDNDCDNDNYDGDEYAVDDGYAVVEDTTDYTPQEAYYDGGGSYDSGSSD